jgi:hypothetical protein
MIMQPLGFEAILVVRQAHFVSLAKILSINFASLSKLLNRELRSKCGHSAFSARFGIALACKRCRLRVPLFSRLRPIGTITNARFSSIVFAASEPQITTSQFKFEFSF